MAEIPSIALSSIVRIARQQISRDLGGEAVILDMASGVYYGLNGVGTRVWELMREPIRVDRIRDIIAREYEVQPDRCLDDILKLLRQLAERGLIEVADGDSA